VIVSVTPTPAFKSGTGGRRILVLSGWEPELKALREALDGDRALARRVAAAPAGVGLVEAGIGAARAIAKTRPRAVIFVGTAGAYATTLAPGTAIVARRVKLVSAAVLRAEGYLPSVMPVAFESDMALRRGLARASRLPVADVACPVAISSARAAARRIARASRCAVENLEAFAVGRAAAASEVPFAAVLGVSNAVGPRAHAEWRRFAADASAAACAAVVAWLSR
jgi:nucleoside phosphorylase